MLREAIGAQRLIIMDGLADKFICRGRFAPRKNILILIFIQIKRMLPRVLGKVFIFLILFLFFFIVLLNILSLRCYHIACPPGLTR